jgi:ectoine hydroxylase-related dioxygenase (phytanoyl-CoA dioxygenase family)
MSEIKQKIHTDKNFLNLPWTESPFFYDLLHNNQHTEEQIEIAKKFHEDGYVIIDTELSDEEISLINNDVESAVLRDSVNLQAEFYTYSNSPRVFEEWRNSENIKNLCLNNKIIETLEFLYNKKTFPFSTINFIKGSNQPLHSDAIHFHTIPLLWMSGVWVALEDTTTENGTLNIVPKSHKWEMIDYQTLQLPHPDEIENGEEVNYRIYEEVIRNLVKSKNAEILPVELKKGQALIWAANLLHGGMEIKNLELTRKTQAIHYFYGGCTHYFHPMFSNIFEGKYANKWCNEEKNIRAL